TRIVFEFPFMAEVTVCPNYGRQPGIGIVHHGSKLVENEMAAVLPTTDLLVDDGSWRSSPNEDRCEEENRQQAHQQKAPNDNVIPSRNHAVVPGQPSCTGCWTRKGVILGLRGDENLNVLGIG